MTLGPPTISYYKCKAVSNAHIDIVYLYLYIYIRYICIYRNYIYIYYIHIYIYTWFMSPREGHSVLYKKGSAVLKPAKAQFGLMVS